jgi:hypothetical protein
MKGEAVQTGVVVRRASVTASLPLVIARRARWPRFARRLAGTAARVWASDAAHSRVACAAREV